MEAAVCLRRFCFAENKCKDFLLSVQHLFRTVFERLFGLKRYVIMTIWG